MDNIHVTYIQLHWFWGVQIYGNLQGRPYCDDWLSSFMQWIMIDWETLFEKNIHFSHFVSQLYRLMPERLFLVSWLTGGMVGSSEAWALNDSLGEGVSHLMNMIWHSARFRGWIVGLLPPQMRAGPSPLPRSWCCSYFWRHKIGLKLKIKYGWRQGTHGGIHSQLWADVFDTLLKLKHRRGLINGIPTDARVFIFGSDILVKIILMSSIS